MKKTIYNNLRLDILEAMIQQRDISCRKTKNEMIKYLILDDEEKYIRETIYDKIDKETYLTGIDTRNTNDLISISRLIEKGEVKNSELYQLNRIFFTSKKKIEL